MKEQLDWIPLYINDIQKYTSHLTQAEKGEFLEIICFVINSDFDLKNPYNLTSFNFNKSTIEKLELFSFFKNLSFLIEKQKNKRNVLRENSKKGGKANKNRYKQKDSQKATHLPSLTNSKYNNNSKDKIGVQGKEKDYFFKGRIIKLDEQDFNRWKESYSKIDLVSELQSLDDYYYQNKITDWYLRCSTALAKKNTQAPEKPVGKRVFKTREEMAEYNRKQLGL